jgi:2-hydroxychromene-2-carboxylate isomerase
MIRSITFFFSVLSPWVYFSGPRFHAIAERAKARIEYRPIDLLRVLRDTGGQPLAQMHPSRREYRRIERERWSRSLGMPVSEKPKHHPVDESTAACMLLAAEATGRPLWPLAQAFLESVWVRDLDISDPATLERVAEERGYAGSALLAAAGTAEIHERFEACTAEALARGVFGVPTFIVDGERFFGQDRLDFVARALGLPALP